MQIVEYLTEEGNSPFAAWFDRLDSQGALGRLQEAQAA